MKRAEYPMRRVIYDLSRDTSFFRTLFETPHFGIVITDLCGEILEVNKAAEQKISSVRKGNNFFHLCTVESESDVAFFEGQNVSDQLNFLLKVEDNTYSVYRLRQSAALYVWIITLTTDERCGEQAKANLLRKNEALAKVRAQMDKFLYSTSHDLRSPLTSILGLVNLIRIEQPTSLIQDYIEKIEDAVERLDMIIQNTIRFSQNSYQRLQSEKMFLENIIWNTIKSYKNHGQYKRINFEVNVEENGTFYSDGERIQIILNNIIQNAILYSDENKSKPFITIHAKANEEGVVIEILDNGIGIGKTHLDNIFNMFYRATERSQGAGLGLFVVKEAVTRLQGTIQVQSEIGFGSIFKITIPNDPKGRLVSKKLKLQEGKF